MDRPVHVPDGLIDGGVGEVGVPGHPAVPAEMSSYATQLSC